MAATITTGELEQLGLTAFGYLKQAGNGWLLCSADGSQTLEFEDQASAIQAAEQGGLEVLSIH